MGIEEEVLVKISPLTSYFKEKFHINTEISKENFEEVLGFMIPSPYGLEGSLILSRSVTPQEALDITVHSLSHAILGHTRRPFCTFIEFRDFARDKYIEKDLADNRQADILTNAILGSKDGNELSSDLEPLGMDTENDVLTNYFRSHITEVRKLLKDISL